MLNNISRNPFSHQVSLDPKAFPAAPQAPKATGLIGDTWNFKPRETQPQLVIPEAPQSNWVDKLLGFLGMTPVAGPAIPVFWKAAPKVLQDATEVAQGLWGAAQSAWNAVSGWFSPAPAPAPAPAPEPAEAEPTTTWQPTFEVEPQEEPSADELAEQARAIRRRVRIVLKRDATEAEVADFQKRMAEGATLSDIHQALKKSPEGQIAKIFQEEVGRDIDERGRAFWMNEYHQGEDLEDIRQRIRVIVGKSREV